RLRDERLCRRIPLARHRPFLDRALFDRPHRFAGDAIERVDPSLFGRLSDRLDRPAIDDKIHQDRRARDIHVPDAMVHQLEMPLALTGLEVKRYEACAEQIVAWTMAAVVIAGWELHRQEHRVRL